MKKLLIIGLGNPGKRYQLTRHNIGFRVLDRLALLWELSWQASSTKSLVCEKKRPYRIVLAKPLTYMNLSGDALVLLRVYYQIAIEQILVVCDDFSLELGQIRIRKKGSSGGHKGLDSLLRVTETDQIARIRLGIGHPYKDEQEYVLEKFKKEEEPIVEEMINKACQAIETIISSGIENAMNKFNIKNAQIKKIRK